ncbi:O-antigen polymerase [Anaerococcus hydrogenalis DSM 7454]|uniref:O-antigen polymerase n=2 Tax=Anaerococcus hydrogenalis TaxID=33029 RepID=B6W7H0_9FIRM|nr:O-antigen polymerase [Anaerococcus hydrogenalis DSM 7454]
MDLTNRKQSLQYNKRYLIDKILITIMLFYILIPPYINSILDKNTFIRKIIILLFIIITGSIIVFNKIKVDKYLIWITISYIFLIISTIINNGRIYDSIISSFMVVIISLFIIIARYKSYLSNILIYSIRNITFFIFLLNTIISIFMPYGLNKMVSNSSPEFLYGNINSNFKYIIPGILCSILIDKKQNKSISFITLFFYIGTLYTYFFIYQTMTAILGLLVIVIWMGYRKFIEKNIFTIFSGIVVFIILFNIIIVYNSDSKVSLFFIKLFGKNETLNNRTYLWNNIIKLIKNNILLGYGLQNEEFIGINIGNYYGSHNYYLDLIFSRGIIGSIFIFMLILSINKNIYKLKELTDLEYILLGIIVVYLFMFLFEPFINYERFFIPLFYILNRELSISKYNYKVDLNEK